MSNNHNIYFTEELNVDVNQFPVTSCPRVEREQLDGITEEG